MVSARSGSRKLQTLSPLERANVISDIADQLVKRQEEILLVNKKDLDKALLDGIKGSMYSRLALTRSKIEALATGLHQIAESSYDNVGRTLRHVKVSDTLNLVQKTVPIGNNIILEFITEKCRNNLPPHIILKIIFIHSYCDF